MDVWAKPRQTYSYMCGFVWPYTPMNILVDFCEPIATRHTLGLWTLVCQFVVADCVKHLQFCCNNRLFFIIFTKGEDSVTAGICLSVRLSFCLKDFNYISWKEFLPKIKGQYQRLRDCDPSQPCNLVLLLSVHVLKSHYAGGWAAWWRSELSQSFTAGCFFIEVQ